jgi:uncharacterized membrane protein (Fun14 family)
MQRIVRLISTLALWWLLSESLFAEAPTIGKVPKNGKSILDPTKDVGLLEVLTFIEGFLLKVILPVVIVGSGLYIAYQLLTAEWNEEKNKKAWKSLTFSFIGVISIALAYAIIAIVARLSI